ncbi:MAG TPA: DUF1786 family protein [Anaerolineae bacterium]
MQILTVDIGTGTQDILLFDSERTPENCLKLVMPSPTLLLSERIRRATQARQPLLISGVLMGGGPCSWAVEAHHRAGLPVTATPDAARTFNDDLDKVQADLGVTLVSAEEAAALAAAHAADWAHVEFRDFDFEPIRHAFAAFGLELRPDAVAAAVFDHGAAPPGVSDRKFRMDYLTARLHHDRRLSTFAARGEDVPPVMTRLQALASTAAAQTGLPVVVMDTAPAAVLGAGDDPVVAGQPDAIVLNVGNFHTLAFQYRDGQFVRLFEHHTGELNAGRLAHWLQALASGEIEHQAVYDDHGHGALCLDATPAPLTFVAVTGPRRGLAAQTGLPIYGAVPHGDQMIAGCFGILRACADVEPDWREPIVQALAGKKDRSLW